MWWRDCHSVETHLDPGVAAGAAVPFVVGVKMPRVPPGVTLPVPLGQRHHLVHRRKAVGRLGDPLVQQRLHPTVIKPLGVPAKRPVANAQNPCGFLLRETSTLPAPVRLLESHLPNLLQQFRPSHVHLPWK